MLPQVGFQEFLLLAIVALVVIGPEDLPMMMRKLGRWVGKMRAMAREFQSAFDDIAKQAELDELRKEIEELKRENAFKDAATDLKEIEDEINAEVMRTEAAVKKPSDPEPEGGPA